MGGLIFYYIWAFWLAARIGLLPPCIFLSHPCSTRYFFIKIEKHSPPETNRAVLKGKIVNSAYSERSLERPEIHSPWLGGLSWLWHKIFHSSPSGYIAWRAGTTTPMPLSTLSSPVRFYELGYNYLDWSVHFCSIFPRILWRNSNGNETFWIEENPQLYARKNMRIHYSDQRVRGFSVPCQVYNTVCVTSRALMVVCIIPCLYHCVPYAL